MTSPPRLLVHLYEPIPYLPNVSRLVSYWPAGQSHRNRVEAIAVSTHLLFHPGGRATARSAEELRRGLADHMGAPCSVSVHNGTESLCVRDAGIDLKLAFGENGELSGAETHLSYNLEVKHVTALFKAFRELGWNS